MRSRAVVLLSLSLSIGPVAGVEAQRALFDPPKNAEPIHREESRARFVPRERALTPCAPSSAVAFKQERKGQGIWAGRFRVVRLGAGVWTLIVVGGNGQRWSEPVSAPHPAGRYAQSPVFHTSVVTITLEGNGNTSCPLVRLESELEAHTPSKPRGIVGPDDDRWFESSPLLAQQQDAAVLRPWANAVVHLQIVSATGYLLPCTGFFITRDVLMTAAHCIATPAEAPLSHVYLGNRIVTGDALKLLMSQEDLDFSLLLVSNAQHPATLFLGETQDPKIVLWQQPVLDTKLVSVHECRLQGREGSRIAHKCDSSGGASGAPIQARASGAVIALHTAGCSESAGSGTVHCVNFGVRAAQIRERILKLGPDLLQWDPAAGAAVLEAMKRF